MVVKHVNLKDKTTPQAKIPRPNSDWNWIQRSNCGDSVASHHPSDDWSLGSSLHAGVDECAYMILARLNCIYNSRSPSKITVINLTKVWETASNYQCIRVAPAKGQSLKIWDDSSIDALIEAFTQVQTLQTAWKSHRCQALIEVLRVNLNRLSGEDQTFGCWVEAFLQPFMQHHHAKTARQQSYCTCGVLVLIKLLYMRVEKRLAWSRRHCPCPSPVALLSMQSWPSRYIGSCSTVFSNTAQNPGCTTNNTCISAALPS